MVGQDDNEEDHNDGDDNRIVYSDENQNTIENDNNSNTDIYGYVGVLFRVVKHELQCVIPGENTQSIGYKMKPRGSQI